MDLEPWIDSAFVSIDGANDVVGFFYPFLRGGMIVADTPDAGLGLVHFKAPFLRHSLVPSGNHLCLDLLSRLGHRETARETRMCAGEDLVWEPEGIFSL